MKPCDDDCPCHGLPVTPLVAQPQWQRARITSGYEAELLAEHVEPQTWEEWSKG